MTKICKKCSIEKPLSEFYTQPKSKDRVAPNCKACALDYQKQRSKANPLQRRIYDRERQRKLRSTQEGRSKIAAIRRESYHRNPQKTKARYQVKHAIKTGKLIKGPCSVCGVTEKVHGHHSDYSKPLEVQWLCEEHHQRLHGKKVCENIGEKNRVL